MDIIFKLWYWYTVLKLLWIASVSRKMYCEICVYSWYRRSFDCWDWMELLLVLTCMHVNICKYVDIFLRNYYSWKKTEVVIWSGPFQLAKFFHSTYLFSHWDNSLEFECQTYIRELFSLLVKHMKPVAMNG